MLMKLQKMHNDIFLELIKEYQNLENGPNEEEFNLLHMKNDDLFWIRSEGVEYSQVATDIKTLDLDNDDDFKKLISDFED